MRLNIFRKRKDNNSSKLDELNFELKNLGSSLILTSGRAEFGNRFNQFFGFNSIDFWMNDICLQSYTKVSDIPQLARIIYGWCELELSGIELEAQVPKFNISKKMILATSSTKQYLEFNWKSILEYSEEFRPLTELLRNHPVTKDLMSFRQLFDLGLSRYIGGYNGIFINDLPRIRVTDDGRYKVMTPEQAFKGGDLNKGWDNPEHYLGVGNAEEALEIIIKNLPENIEPARFMTEDDLMNNRKGL